jgi:hypothetical protein
MKAARSACKNSLESLSLQQEPSSGGIETLKSSKERMRVEVTSQKSSSGNLDAIRTIDHGKNPRSLIWYKGSSQFQISGEGERVTSKIPDM